MSTEVEPVAKNLEVVLSDVNLRRLTGFSYELIQYQDFLNDLLNKGIFRTHLKDEVREQVAYMYSTEKAFSALARDLQAGEKVRIIPLPEQSQTDHGIALEPSSWWTGNLGWQRFETLLKVLYPIKNKYTPEFSSIPTKIRGALKAGQEVTLTREETD